MVEKPAVSFSALQRREEREQAEAEEEQEQEGAKPIGRQLKRQKTTAQLMMEAAKSTGDSLFARVLQALDSLALQTVLYFTFVLIFQLIASSLRVPQEYYLKLKIMEDVVMEEFDSSHNTFESIRRIADVYEWGNNVLWPALFGNVDSCNPSATGSRTTPKGCLDYGWADGEGTLAMQGMRGWRVSQAVELMDLLDWTDGVFIRQMRAAPVPCARSNQLERQGAEELIADGFTQPALGPDGGPPAYTGANAAKEYAEEVNACYPELRSGQGSKQPFGHNHTHPASPMWEPWTHWMAE
jgi:hypothetical protein